MSIVFTYHLSVITYNIRVKAFLTSTGEIAIAIFCIFQMLAIAVYATPDPFSTHLISLKPWITPYILITSQWQGWDLFSPDPIRRVAEYNIEIQEGETWRTILHIAGGELPSRRRADEIKYLNRIETNEATRPLRVTYLHDVCRRFGIDSGTPIRFMEHAYVLPATGEELARVAAGSLPIPYDTMTADTVCP